MQCSCGGKAVKRSEVDYPGLDNDINLPAWETATLTIWRCESCGRQHTKIHDSNGKLVATRG